MNSRVIILVIICLFAVRYLLLPGFIPTHDGEFHFVRFWQFEKMLLSGDYFPVWAPDLNSGYGLPLFYYQYPMPNYFGVLFHTLGFSYTDSFKLTLASFYLSAVIFFYLWSKSLWASLLFGWTPYWFVNLFVRGSIGEVMASAGFAFVLWATGARRKVLIALGVAFIILSHNIAAMLFIPVLLVYGWHQRRAVFLGVLMSAYFWLPALTGGSYIVGLSNVNIFDHFSDISQLIIPSWGTGFSRPGAPYNELSQQLGLGTILIWLVAVVMMRRSIITYALVLIAFMTTYSSQFIWKTFSYLHILQYPWRLLMFIPFIAGFLAAQIAARSRVLSIIVLISIALSLSYTKPVIYEPRSDQYYLSRREFTDGTSSLGNSMSTSWTPWKRERAGQKIEIIEGTGTIQLQSIEPTRYRFIADASSPAIIRVNTVYFPGWEMMVNNQWQSLEPDSEGLMQISVLPGKRLIHVELHNTPVRNIGLFISFVSFIWLITSGILDKYANRDRHYATLLSSQRQGSRKIHKTSR